MSKSPILRSTSKGKKVFVGLSGGVDSAVSAALLKEQGYEVTGVFIKVWQQDWLPCTWREERRDAMRVAARLNIPFLFFDFEDEYKKGVADYMIEEYRKGRTPNPDVMCNREIKFGAFWQKAKAMGADYIATGHYLSGANNQDYFLWMLTQEDYDHSLFPVGHMEKSEVRKLAKKFDIPVSEKKDSQGICFLGDVNIEEFLSHFIKTEQGDVLNTKGDVIGKHNGALYYTLGERKGFEITKNTSDSKPYYVITKDVTKNTLTVSNNEKEIQDNTPIEVTIENVNWIGGHSVSTCEARIRYRQEKFQVTLTDNKVKFSSPQTATPGQSIVFYDGDNLLGGTIVSDIVKV